MRIEPQINPLNPGEELNAVAEGIASNESEFDDGYPIPSPLTGHVKRGSAFNFNGQSGGAAATSSSSSQEYAGPHRPAIKVTNITNSRQVFDTLYTKSKSIACNNHACSGSIMAQVNSAAPRSSEEILDQAVEFLEQFFIYAKKPNSSDFAQRLAEIATELDRTRTYVLTTEELHFGTKTAWRNAARCIGRIQWNNLQLQDARHVSSTSEMFDFLCKHIELATNGGNLRSFITVFPQRVVGRDDFRVWNSQLISYAGYRQVDGSVIGDPGRVEFTQICQRLGWKGKNGRFDVLPLVLSAPNESVKFYEIPEEIILRVKLIHPKIERFEELDLQWYALPAVAEMQFDCGGLVFPCCPFNGWYMGTEIGARDLCDPQRYNLTEQIAIIMGLDVSNNSTLWRDKAVIETNVAVLHSYQKAGVTIVDHHSASESFIKHMNIEYKQRGGCPADWVWIVPPVSGSICSVFHQEMLNYSLRPSFEYQDKAWKSHKWTSSYVKPKYTFASVAKTARWVVQLMAAVLVKRVRATILYATETGKSESFALKLAKLMKMSFSVRTICMENYDFDDITKESLLLVISSTFGNGEAPDNGKEFWKKLFNLRQSGQIDRLSDLKYGVFALGSRQYPSFCAFGKNVDKVLLELGATQALPIGLGDELKGQESDFNSWGQECYKSCCQAFDISIENNEISIKNFDDNDYDKNKVRISEMLSETNEHHLHHELARIHHKKIISCNIITRVRLQSNRSERQTLLVRLSPSNPISKAQLNYEPGDHLAIFPANPKEMVNPLIGHLIRKGYKEVDSPIQVQHLVDGKWCPDTRIPVCSLRVALTQYLDIASAPSQKFLSYLIDMANDNWDSFRLTKLANDIDDYEKWRSYNKPNMVDILNQFPSIHMSAEFLLTQLPLLQPRFYSVSSSRKVTPDEVHLTMDLASYQIHDGLGPKRLGLCSSFIDRLPDVEIPCFLRSAPAFRLPENKKLPIIMVCAGSGIAPFRSFWLERQVDIQNGETCGKMFLFFGCRNSKQDHIYEQDLTVLTRKGVIHELFVTFSREKDKKKDQVFKQRALLYWLIINESAHIYVCGHSLMADGVKKSFLKMFESEANMNDNEAHKFLTNLTNDGRYHEDVFGIY